MRRIVLFMVPFFNGRKFDRRVLVIRKPDTRNGIPLFKNIKSMTKLKLMSTRAFDSGVVGSNYVVIK